MDKVIFILDRLNTERKIATLLPSTTAQFLPRDLRALAGDRSPAAQMGNVQEMANKGEAASTVEAPDRQQTVFR